MKETDFLTVYSVILTILTFVITVLSGYVAYISITLKKKVKSEVIEEFRSMINSTEDQLQLRVEIVDKLIHTAIKEIEGTAKEPSKARTQLYALSHILRLTSGNEDEVMRSLEAFEQLGEDAFHLIAFVERIRSKSNWPAKSEEQYGKILKSAEDRRFK